MAFPAAPEGAAAADAVISAPAAPGGAGSEWAVPCDGSGPGPELCSMYDQAMAALTSVVVSHGDCATAAAAQGKRKQAPQSTNTLPQEIQ